MTLYLIRHSITSLNSAATGFAVMCGSTQAHVTDKGIELAQKRRAEYDFSDDLEKVKDIYCSTLDRTMETANAMFPDLVEKVTIHRCSAFDEIDFGDYETVPKNDLPEDILDLWDNTPEKLTFPNGDNMMERAVAGVKELVRLAETSDVPVIVISSSTVLRMMLTIIMNIPANKFHDISMDNCNIIKLEYEGDGSFKVYME